LAENIVLGGKAKVQEAINVLHIKKDFTRANRNGPNKDISHYSEPMTIEEQNKAIAYLTKGLSQTVAKYMVTNILEPTYSKNLFDGTKAPINQIFDVIQNKLKSSVTDDGIVFKFMEPAVVMDWLEKHPDKTIEDFPYREHRKYRLSGDKYIETEIKIDDTVSLLPLTHANKTSAHILPIHAKIYVYNH